MESMFEGKDLPNNLASDGENSQSKLLRHITERMRENSDSKSVFSEKGINFREESMMGSDGFLPKSSKIGNSSSQELTLSYLCENSKLGSSEKEIPGKVFMNSFEKASYKGKEVMFSDDDDDKWVERDFLNLNNSSKREVEEEEEEIEGENHGKKKQKLETLNLSLALNGLQNEDPHPVWSKPSRSFQSSLAPSMNNNTQTTCSNDFTAASLSYSYSHQFSHNPSCSLTHNSTENYEYSVGRDDHIWNCGEGTNGSVHSRFKPLGDGSVTFSNHGGGVNSLMQGNRPLNKELCNNSEDHSFLPSELPARPRIEVLSGNSRGRGSENLKGLEGVTRPERILREIVSESISVIAQIVQELPDEILSSVKDYLKDLIAIPEKRHEFVSLQNRIERRSDLTKETLSKCHKVQLEILVAAKMGLSSFISGKSRCSVAELVDIFLFLKCKNCKSVIPVDDCDCKFCSANKGFCSSCMCPICLNFDCANNTCSWVGCDVCSHWCHAACGIEKNLIRPGPSLKGPSGTTEMQFHCIACNHASEMFGFVKDVFVYCAKDWGLETLMKELECVKRIFIGSDDYKGKDLYIKASQMLSKLERKTMAPWEACHAILEYFNYGTSEIPTNSSVFSEKLGTTDTTSLKKERMSLPQSSSLPSTYTLQKKSPPRTHSDLMSSDHRQNDLKVSFSSDLNIDDEFQFATLSKKGSYESLESIVRIKKAEAGMFQNKADEARREAEQLRQIINAKTQKLDDEYAEKLSKLCLQETEDTRRKKLEELKALENSQSGYYNMKMRMQKEIGCLLERMEVTKKQII